MPFDIDALIDNLTAFNVRAFPMIDRHGADVITAVAKVTWTVSAAGEVSYALPQRPIRPFDEMLTDGPFSSVTSPSDRVDEKPGTDVIMVGHAWPSGSASQMEVSLRVETGDRALAKSVRVFGNRVFIASGSGVSRSKPLAITAPVPLVYELADGGADIEGQEEALMDPLNPAGVGVARDKKKLVDTQAPQIESLSGEGPAGFGAIAEGWGTRSKYSGTFDEAWSRKRAPLRPSDFDPRFNCVANPDLWSETPLSGSEPVEVLGATASGVWRFKLPLFTPRFEATVDGEKRALDTHLDTVFIDANEGQVELCWRASVALPRKVARLQKMTVLTRDNMPPEVAERADADLATYRERERATQRDQQIDQGEVTS